MKNANRITLLRIALIPVFMALWYFTEWYWALGVFLLSALTDKLDGYVARKYNQVTNFGKFIDPLADKLLICSALVILVADGRVSAVVVFIIVARELIITSLRTLAMSEGRVLAADWLGKLKMVVQVVVTAYLLCPQTGINGGFTVGDICAWVMAAVTVWSGLEYCITNRDIIGRP